MLISRANRVAGFTLIEMVITVTIFGLIVALTVPAMRTWVANTKVRAVADALQNGLRLAQSESLRRSRQVVFSLTTSTTPTVGNYSAAANGTYWVVQTIPAMLDGSETAAVVGSGILTSAGTPISITGPAAICFNSAGRIVAQATTGVAGATCTAPTTVVNNSPMVVYNIQQASADRQLNVQVGLGGHLHLCDPKQTLSAANSYGC